MSIVERSGYSLARLALAGAGLLALAVALAAGSAIGPLGDAVTFALERAGTDYVIAAALGILAVLTAAMVFVSGRGATMRQTRMPDVERPVPVQSAGESVDEAISRWRVDAPVVGRSTRADLRDRLRAAAVDTVAAAEGCSRRDARNRVEAGTWTDDEVAAAYLADERASIGAWLPALGNRETATAYRVRRAVDAIVDRRGLDAPVRAGVGEREFDDGRGSQTDRGPDDGRGFEDDAGFAGDAGFDAHRGADGPRARGERRGGVDG